MNGEKERKYLLGLVKELRLLPFETEWVEFKMNKVNPEEVGEYISALSNSASLFGKANGYIVWGVDDTTHEIVGTSFNPYTTKVGNEELENWLLRLLSPKIHFRFHVIDVNSFQVVILEIPRASHKPVQFKGLEYIRIGSYKKKLKEFPEKERQLWRIFDKTPFEEITARENVLDADVLQLLDYPVYFDLLDIALPENRQGILEWLTNDDMITPCEAGGWNITNMGAILFAKRLDDFPALKRKAVRLVMYKNNSRLQTIREKLDSKGYASGFEGLIGFINTILPVNEVLGQALRKEVPMYPEIAVRELIVNAIIHQDFFISGTGPMIEVFSNRMEITNPGIPLIKTERFLDSPPRSRNEALASFLRRAGICEERGSGIDRVVFATEYYQLPAPIFEQTDEHTRVILFSQIPIDKMEKKDRIRACYLHACLKYVNREFMTNSSLRNRFGIQDKNSTIASRIIKDTIDAGLIRPLDSAASKKYIKYVPSWS